MSSFAAGDIPVSLRLRAIEAKLLSLSLDSAARGNEITTAAQKLIDSLRARGVTAAEIFCGSKPTSVRADDTALARAMAKKMCFGKHKHKLLRDVPMDYLRWARDNCTNMSADLRDAIQVILKGY